MIDVHTIGAGGGSVVWLDKAKLLHVGPESAAAAPGPACYNQGGKKPTVSDANFILGRLPSELAGQLRLDRSAAVTAFTPLARALQMDLEEVAVGAVKIVNEQMQQALNVMSVYKGYDPSDFVLAGFGAAAGLHICALADGLTIQRSIMPAHAGVLSALGIWVAGGGVQKTLSVCKPLNKIKQDELDALHQRLSAQALGGNPASPHDDKPDGRAHGAALSGAVQLSNAAMVSLGAIWKSGLILLTKNAMAANSIPPLN